MVAKKKATKKRTVKSAPKKPDSITRKKAKAAVKKVVSKKKTAVKKKQKKAVTKRKPRVAKKKSTTKKKTTAKRKVAPKKKVAAKKKVATKKKTTTKKKAVVAKATTVKKKAAVRKKAATKKAPVKKAPARRRTTNYLNNRDMLAQVIQSKADDYPTPTLANMFMLLVARYGKKYSYANYTYNDDMQAYALMMLVKTWRSFKPEKSSNPFAFFTQCIKNSFIQYLNQERKQRNIRDEMLVDKGLTPSYTFQLAHEEKSRERRESDDEICQPDHVGVGEAREEPTV